MKDLPRYKTISRLEAGFKKDYAKVLASTLTEFIQALESLKTIEEENKINIKNKEVKDVSHT